MDATRSGLDPCDLPLMDSDDDEFLSKAVDEADEEDYAKEDYTQSISSKEFTLEKQRIPINFIKRGRSGLSVSDLVNQFWCEQQFEYSFTHPVVKPTLHIATIGSSIHLERELEVHDIVSVVCKTIEDSWALKFLNCYHQLVSLSQGATIREFQLYGVLWEDDIFINGIVDEIRISNDYKIEIHELKTRSKRTLPTVAQQRKDQVQVMIYRKLLADFLVCKKGHQTVKKFVQLNWKHKLCDDVRLFSEDLMVPCLTLKEVLDVLENFLQAVNFPEFGATMIEYSYQGDKSIIDVLRYDYDESWLQEVIAKQFDYLFGRRAPTGVDIEEAWKCCTCDYYKICSWRQAKENKYKETNALNFCSKVS